jgi:predicted Zn-dependent peptidase
MAGGSPPDAEVAMASRYLSDSFLFRTETLGAVADLTVKLAVLGLPDDYFDSYRRSLRMLDVPTVTSAAQRYYTFKHPLIIVAGDASKLAKPLSHFAKVQIVDPGKDFSSGKMLPKDESASIEGSK